MNWLDCVLIVVLGWSAVRSFLRGFTREIVGLAAALCALVMGMWFYGLAGSYVAPHVGAGRVANLLGFVLVVLGVLVCGTLVGWVVSRFLRTIGLSFFDRLLGAAFGLLRGLLIAVALLTAYTAFGPNAADNTAPEAVVHSRIAPYVLDASHYFTAIAPMDLKQSFGKQYSDIEKALQQTVRGKDDPARKEESGDK